MNNTSSQSNPASKRIDYLDLLKGAAILWIVWYHQPHPAFVDHYYHVPIFFFVSGILYKQKEFKHHILGILWHIIIPFIFFYLISYCFQIVRFYFENQSLCNFEWKQIFDLFRKESYIDHLLINRPLWFLVSLAEIQILYFIIGRLPKIAILSLCLAILIAKEYILSWQTYFLLNQSVYWLTYYALGDIVGKRLVNCNNQIENPLFSKYSYATLDNKHSKYAVIILLIAIYVVIRLSPHFISNSFLISILYEMEVFSFVVISILTFSCFKAKSTIAKCLLYYGKNSLIVLGIHIPLTIIYGGILFRLFGITGNIWIGLAIFVLVIITLIPLIYLLRKYFYRCVGVKAS